MGNVIREERRDLSAIGYNITVPLYSDNGLTLDVRTMYGELVVCMHIDGINVMDTSLVEHSYMQRHVTQCPENARVLIGGLGFGLVLLYLAESKRSKEVIVIEKDDRVLNKFKVPILAYLKKWYPEFNIQIIKGDIYEEIIKHGFFDWIFIDLIDSVTKEFRVIAQTMLNPNGKQNHYGEGIKLWQTQD